MTDEVHMYPLGDGNFTSNDSYCPPLDDRYSLHTNTDIIDGWIGDTCPESTETYQLLKPYNNFSEVTHLWLFPAIIEEYNFYILAQTISWNYVFKEVDFTNSYDCDIIEQMLTVDDEEEYHMLFEKNTGTNVSLLSRTELRGFFNLAYPNRCII